MSNRAYAPPGWPDQVRPPGAPDWEATATAFLFDCCPPDLRGFQVLRRQPLVLVRFADIFVRAQQEAAERGLAEVRTILKGRVEPYVIGQAVEAWSEQAARLTRTRRAVGLVEEALLGRVFAPRLADRPQRAHSMAG
ncbi:hypothetical protein [Microlunatus ginsengisoli]|uniref:Uncharacterized protein n=1 Tax=Microlunatus ginsengisoli TaxID=363863 RepID=A0ABP6ZJ92_9ACTN